MLQYCALAMASCRTYKRPLHPGTQPEGLVCDDTKLPSESDLPFNMSTLF